MLVAIVFAEGIRPLVHRLQRRRVPLPLAIILVYVGLILFLGIMVALLVQPIVSEARTLAANFPTYQSDFLNFFNSLQHQFHFNVNVSQQVGGVLGATQKVLFAIGGTIFGVVVNFFLMLVLGFLWLVSSDRLKRFVVDLVPVRNQALATDVIREIGFRTGGYVRAVAINSLAVGVADRRRLRAPAAPRSHPARHLRRPHRGSAARRAVRGGHPGRAHRVHRRPGVPRARARCAARDPARSTPTPSCRW